MTAQEEHRATLTTRHPVLRSALVAAVVGVALMPIGFLVSDGVDRLVDPDNTCELECVVWILPIYAAWALICWALLRLVKVPLAKTVTFFVTVAGVGYNGSLTYQGPGQLVVSCAFLGLAAAAGAAITTSLRALVLRRRAARHDAP